MNNHEEDSSLSENEFYVEEILDKKVEAGITKYLVKWEGWSIDQSTWEPVRNLSNIKNLIQDFEQKKSKEQSSIKDTDKPTESYKMNSNKKQIKNETESQTKKKIDPPVVQDKSDIKAIDDFANDIPESVISVKRDKSGEILCLTRFKERPDGIRVENAYVTSSLFKDHYPKILIEYYESKIKFVEKKY